jgi:3-hydroxyacyl-[acyl-carrier-protein] dehydratase
MAAAQPLVDLTGLDLSQTVYSHDELYGMLKQAGRFALLDQVVRHEESEDFSVASKAIKADDWWAEDHIPGRPLFPGVLMVEACAQLGSWDFLQRHPEHQHRFIGFVRIGDTRFRGTVEPACELIFVAKLKRFRSLMFTYTCQGIVDGKVMFDTEISGMAM